MRNLNRRLARLEVVKTQDYGKLENFLCFLWRVAYRAGRIKDPEPDPKIIQELAHTLIGRYGDQALKSPLVAVAHWNADRKDR
jgi:hypothetical protein